MCQLVIGFCSQSLYPWLLYMSAPVCSSYLRQGSAVTVLFIQKHTSLGSSANWTRCVPYHNFLPYELYIKFKEIPCCMFIKLMNNSAKLLRFQLLSKIIMTMVFVLQQH